jgi:hypothetical protein
MENLSLQRGVRFKGGNMRALSIRQPYVELILKGVKKVEFRSKNTLIRGKFYIYSSKTPAVSYEDEAKGLPAGVIVGTAELVDCVFVDDSADPNYEWHLKNPKRFKRPLKPKNKPQPVWFNPF